MKKAVKGSFPNLGQGAVTVTAAQLNTVVAALAGSNPVGAIIMFNGSFAAIPSNWQLCDGTNGTPNMVNRFVYGTNTQIELLDAGGSANAVNVSHTHSATVNDPGHFHTSIEPINTIGRESGPDPIQWQSGTRNTSSSNTGISVTVVASGVAGTNLNIPPYIKLAYIQRMS